MELKFCIRRCILGSRSQDVAGRLAVGDRNRQTLVWTRRYNCSGKWNACSATAAHQSCGFITTTWGRKKKSILVTVTTWLVSCLYFSLRILCLTYSTLVLLRVSCCSYVVCKRPLHTHSKDAQGWDRPGAYLLTFTLDYLYVKRSYDS